MGALKHLSFYRFRAPFFILATVLLLTSLSPPTLAATPEFIREYREQILLRRVLFLLKYRQQALNSCAARTADPHLRRFTHEMNGAMAYYPDPIDELENSNRSCDQDSSGLQNIADFAEQMHRSSTPGATRFSRTLLEAMSFHQRGQQYALLCQKEFAQTNKDLDAFHRKPFQTVKTVVEKTAPGLLPLFNDIDPVCSTPVQRNLVFPDGSGGRLARNHCYGAIPLMDRMIRPGTGMNGPTPSLNGDHDFLLSLNAFQNAIATRINEATLNPKLKSRGIDLFELFKSLEKPKNPKESELQLRKRFLGTLAWLRSSAKSKWGSIDPITDRIWQNAVAIGKSPEEALRLHHIQMNEMDYVLEWLNAARNNGVKLTISGNDVTEYDHHHVITAMIACYYQNDKKVIARTLPKLLGYAYKTKSFFNLMQEGAPLSKGIEEFGDATGKFNAGADFGARFCKN